MTTFLLRSKFILRNNPKSSKQTRLPLWFVKKTPFHCELDIPGTHLNNGLKLVKTFADRWFAQKSCREVRSLLELTGLSLNFIAIFAHLMDNFLFWHLHRMTGNGFKRFHSTSNDAKQVNYAYAQKILSQCNKRIIKPCLDLSKITLRLHIFLKGLLRCVIWRQLKLNHVRQDFFRINLTAGNNNWPGTTFDFSFDEK